MELSALLKEMEALGTEQNRKVYRRHGAGDNLYGLSYANLGKLQKRIKKNHLLALRLWEDGNFDARILATMIADPAQMDEVMLERWCSALDNYVVTDAFARNLVSQTPFAKTKMLEWTKAEEEWRGRAGWILAALLAMSPNALTDAEAKKLTLTIDKTISGAKNRVKDAMNSALIAVGMRGGACEEAALATAKRIGKIAVDHGETGCKTPDAAEYIAKAKARKAKR